MKKVVSWVKTLVDFSRYGSRSVTNLIRGIDNPPGLSLIPIASFASQDIELARFSIHNCAVIAVIFLITRAVRS